MVFARRVSAKKVRFSCKKLAFLELQRFRRLEYERWVNRRKRAKRVFFLPSVNDEVEELSADSVQRILHQGSAFHFSKDVVVKRSDSLHELLFDGLLNVRRLDGHELVLLASVLVKLSASNHSLLSRALVQCHLRFDSLTLAEVAQISYIIPDLPLHLRESFARQWLPNVACLLRQLECNNLDGSDFTSLAKLSYVMSQFPQKYDNELFTLLSSLPVHNGDDMRLFSRDCSLVCQGMLASGIVNYNFLMDACDVYKTHMNHNVDVLEARFQRRASLSYRRVVFTLEDDASEAPVNMDHLLLLLSACDHFNYHNKELISAVCRYVDCYSLALVSDSRAAEHYRSLAKDSPDGLTAKFAELVRSGRYKHPKNNKQQLRLLLKDLATSLNLRHSPFWGINTICNLASKYVTQRRTFSKLLDFVLRHVKLHVLSIEDKSALSLLCQSFQPFHPRLAVHLANLSPDGGTHTDATRDNKPTVSPDGAVRVRSTGNIGSIDISSAVSNFNDLYGSWLTDRNPEVLRRLLEQFSAFADTLPRIMCWECIWKALDVIAAERRLEMLLLVRSFLEESFLGAHPLDKASGNICTVAMHLIFAGSTLSEPVLYLDSCVRIIQLLTSADLSRDYSDLFVFGHYFELFIKMNSFISSTSHAYDEDFRLLVQQLSNGLESYLEAFPRVKCDMLSAPVPRDVYEQVTKAISGFFKVESAPNKPMAELTLELLRGACNAKRPPILRANATLIRHIVLQGSLLPPENSLSANNGT
ncbi:SDR family NAD(P)-dependent oxidoreductase [Babesia caballi]|uniref:SDR family NAD(P)-dependent oxidoreductase n=1 Tax=Babesia caballi TaxID=5871 RepID=A0AAV4LWM4_BABCB|nr:SDR family NAD(P)-dependent oxidoreductase [Babesia caballi]